MRKLSISYVNALLNYLGKTLKVFAVAKTLDGGEKGGRGFSLDNPLPEGATFPPRRHAFGLFHSLHRFNSTPREANKLRRLLIFT